MQSIRDHARAHNLPLWRATEDLLAANALAARAPSMVANFVQLIERLERETAGTALDERASM